MWWAWPLAWVHSPWRVTMTNISLWAWKGVQQMKKSKTTATAKVERIVGSAYFHTRINLTPHIGTRRPTFSEQKVSNQFLNGLQWPKKNGSFDQTLKKYLISGCCRQICPSVYLSLPSMRTTACLPLLYDISVSHSAELCPGIVPAWAAQQRWRAELFFMATPILKVEIEWRARSTTFQPCFELICRSRI